MRIKARTFGKLWLAASLGLSGAAAQTIQPIITEYKGPADGKFAVTNNSLIPLVVILEPRSFDVNEEGKGIYRDLDSTIHVDLSAKSFMLQPQETHYVFYHATAERLPSWFTVYATFAATSHSDNVDVRLVLPHTVYLYSRTPVERGQVEVSSMQYDEAAGKVTGSIVNSSNALVRVQTVKASGRGEVADLSGFPLLPGQKRLIDLPWTKAGAPTTIEFRFPGFTVNSAIAARP